MRGTGRARGTSRPVPALGFASTCTRWREGRNKPQLLHAEQLGFALR